MMKKKYIISFLFAVIANFAFGQTIPRGMNYQAVARGKAGEPVADQDLSLKIILQSQTANSTEVYYEELQKLHTNKNGIFSATIGRGTSLVGNFNTIPWSSKMIWMFVSIKLEGESEFTVLSGTQLMAVPYAYHAETADEIAGSYTPYVLPDVHSNGNTINAGPVPATAWKVTGNTVSNPPTEYLGTSDNVDFVIKTNGIQRMRVLSTGGILMNNSVTIGIDLTIGHDAIVNHDLRVKNDATIDSNLTVKKNVNLNSIAGATVNSGPFTVDKVSPTLLTGSLQVDKSTNLNDSLTVNNVKPTLLTGTLQVNLATDLYNSLTVNSQSPTVLTGTLRTDSNVIMKNHLTLDNPLFNSTDSSNGEVVIAGGVGIGKNLNVGGNLKIAGQTELNGQVLLTDTRRSERPDSGALVITGGAGIGKQIQVAGYTHLYDSLRGDGDAYLGKTLNVADSVTLNNKLNVTGTSTFNGSILANDRMKIDATALGSSAQNAITNYPLQVKGAAQGIAIRVDGNKSSANNYISFWDQNGMQGRIEGMAPGEYSNTSDYRIEDQRLRSKVEFAQLNVATATFNEASAVADVVAAATSSTACVGLGVCATAPLPSYIVASLVNVAGATVLLVENGIALDLANTERSNFDQMASTKTGVTYESGSGDYAEYIAMSDRNETILPGDLVGIKGGKVTRNTTGADKIMVVSRRPIILGNMPASGTEADYKKVAFLGQVEVQVSGKVSVGDYILADGNNLGIGIAVSPKDLKSSDIKKIAGIAWSESKNNFGISLINIAIGLNVNDNQALINNLKYELSLLKQQVAETDAVLRNVAPGYIGNRTTDPKIVAARIGNYTDDRLRDVSPENIVYRPFNRDEITLAVNAVITNFKDSEKLTDKSFIQKLSMNEAMKKSIVETVLLKVNNQLNAQKELDKKLFR